MTSILWFIILTLLVLLGVGCWSFLRHLRRLDASYNKALEDNQKRLDIQSSKLNLLTRALPNLQILLNSQDSDLDSWKSLFLDEARALIRADEASYWRYVEKDQVIELDLSRGQLNNSAEAEKKVAVGSGILGEVAEERMPRLLERGMGETDDTSGMIVPLMVGGNLWGVFQFNRRGENRINQKDLDLIHMFINHLALVLENHDMTFNREKFYLELVQTLAMILDERDASSKGQSRRARELARGTARVLELPNEFIYYLEFAALMHDIGKIAIDDGLLKKPGKLTDEEFEIIKKYPEFGHKILSQISMLAPVAPMVLYHQERFDGKGYPEGLSGEEIPFGARIVAVLDAWGAMTSDRPWRPALKTDVAIGELRKGAGTQFDPQVVEAFVTTIESQGYVATN